MASSLSSLVPPLRSTFSGEQPGHCPQRDSERNCAVWHPQVTLSQRTEQFFHMGTNFLTKRSPSFQGNLFRMTDGKGDTLQTPLTSRSKAGAHQTPYQWVYYHPKTHTQSFFCKRSQHRVRKVCQHQRKFLGDF